MRVRTLERYPPDGETKICGKCGQEKPITEFYRHSIEHKDRHRSYCKVCCCQATPHKRYTNLARQGNHQVLFSCEEFIAWFNRQKPQCYYCGQNLISRNGGRMRNNALLTIDRKDNGLPYTIQNIVICCWRCNRAKGNWFTEQQMLEIAERYFKKC